LLTTIEDIYLGRQPILDREQRIYAFELLFRSGSANRAVIVDDVSATSAVVIRTLSEFGIETVLGKYSGFINCDTAFLMSDEIELLPPEKVVLEILETAVATDAVQQRCIDLKEKGFRFALDDFRGTNSANRQFLPLVDIIKVDIFKMIPSQLEAVTREVTGLNALLLAEKVESQEEFARCSALGYHLFQGYYFSRPEIIAGKRLSPAHVTVIRLLALIQQDAELAEIEEIFKQHPTLGVNLLRLANSAATGLRSPLRSIGSAIVILGRRQLQRWLLLLMLAEGSQGAGSKPLLLHLAATRGRFMELVALPGKGGAVLADSAFIAGIVSVMDALLGLPMEKVVTSLGLAPEVSLALLKREGALGELLNLAQALEEEDQGAVVEFVAAHSQSGVDLLNQTQGKALAWANSITLAT
jgi:c-di-GMP-related signal transduction protein